MAIMLIAQDALFEATPKVQKNIKCGKHTDWLAQYCETYGLGLQLGKRGMRGKTVSTIRLFL